MPWDLMRKHRVIGLEGEMDLTREITRQMMLEFVQTFDEKKDPFDELD